MLVLQHQNRAARKKKNRLQIRFYMLFDGMEKTAKIRKSKIDEELIKIQISDFERSVELQVRNAKTNLSNAKARLATQKENESLSQSAIHF